MHSPSMPRRSSQGCRYRVKLLPGSGKRSATLRAALDAFGKIAGAASVGVAGEAAAAGGAEREAGEERAEARAADQAARAAELALIRALPDADVLPALLSDARVLALSAQSDVCSPARPPHSRAPARWPARPSWLCALLAPTREFGAGDTQDLRLVTPGVWQGGGARKGRGPSKAYRKKGKRRSK
jgi:hypothetical protein